MLRLDNVRVQYEGQVVLDGLSHTFREGAVTAIVGESGIGKSTLMHVLCGLLRPESGQVVQDGARIAAVFQEPRLFPWMTALENVRTVCGKDSSRAERLLVQMGLEDAMHKYPAELSGGMKQRVSIARALAYGADVLLLDEPFRGLDAALRLDVTRQVMEAFAGKTVIMVTHDESDLAYADVVYRLTPPPESRLEEIKR